MIDLKNEIIKYMEAGIPFIFIENLGSSTKKLIDYVQEKKLKKNIFCYDLTSSSQVNVRTENKFQSYKDILLKLIEHENGENLVIINGTQGLLDYENGEVLENIAYRIENYKVKNLTICFIGENYKIPENLKRYSVLLEKKLPNDIEIKNLIEKFLEFQMPNYKNLKFINEDLIKYLKGLNELEINQSLAILYYEYGIQVFEKRSLDLNKRIFEEIKNIKIQILKKTGNLSIVNTEVSLKNDVAGLRKLLEYIGNTKKIIKNSNILVNNKISLPKGLLLVGKPGNGKSLVAKATATTLNLPLINFDISKILGKYVGESEKQMQRSLEIVQAMSPCVLWIDEIEKAFSGINNSNNDTMRKILGIFLTWMSDYNQGVYVIATANSIEENIPPEMVRKGRFDDIFYIDNPSQEERKQIFKLHLKKRNISLNGQSSLFQLAKESENFSGADIEYCCNSAAIDLIINDKELDETMIIQQVIKHIKQIKDQKENDLENIEGSFTEIKDKNRELFNFNNNKEKDLIDEIDNIFKDKIKHSIGQELETYINKYKIEKENKKSFKSANN
jgi:ATP-dependent 26S proteasome regulatory subunit